MTFPELQGDKYCESSVRVVPAEATKRELVGTSVVKLTEWSAQCSEQLP